MRSSIELNKKYNRLLAVRKISKDKHNRNVYEFLCDCGKYIQTLGTRVKIGRTKSCGCLSIEKTKIRNSLSFGEASLS